MPIYYYGVWCQSPQLPCCIYSLTSLTPVLWLSHQFHHGKAIQVRPVQVISVRICLTSTATQGNWSFHDGGKAPFGRESSMKFSLLVQLLICKNPAAVDMETIPFFIVFDEEQLVSRISEPSTVPINKKSTKMMPFKRCPMVDVSFGW